MAPAELPASSKDCTEGDPTQSLTSGEASRSRPFNCRPPAVEREPYPYNPDRELKRNALNSSASTPRKQVRQQAELRNDLVAGDLIFPRQVPQLSATRRNTAGLTVRGPHDHINIRIL